MSQRSVTLQITVISNMHGKLDNLMRNETMFEEFTDPVYSDDPILNVKVPGGLLV